MIKASSLNVSISLSDALIIRPENPIISVAHISLAWCSCMEVKKASAVDATAAAARAAVAPFSFGAVAGATAATGMRRVVRMRVLHVCPHT